MTTPNVIITNAGLQALINAEQTGTDSVKLSKVIYSSEAITASTASVLSDIDPNDIVATLTSVSGTITGEHTIHISAGDASDNAYTVKTIGIVTDDDVLFAVISSDSGLISKIATTQAYVSFDMELTQGNPAYIEFGDTNFLNPDASYSVKGIARFATPTEAGDGLNESKVISPFTLKFALRHSPDINFPLGNNYQYLNVADYMRGQMVFYNDDVYVCLRPNGPSSTVITPGTDKTYWTRILLESRGEQTGDVKGTLNLQDNLNNGWLWMNGARVSRTTYKDLWEFANDNGLVRAVDVIADLEQSEDLSFGPGDGESTFSLPDTTGRVLVGSDGTDLASYKKAELPNINGTIVARSMQGSVPTMWAYGFGYEFHPNDNVNQQIAAGGGSGNSTVNIDLHNIISTYTNSCRVLPLSLTFNYIVKC